MALGDVIATQVAAWGGHDLPLERELFDSTEPDAIASAVDAFCQAELGSAIDHYEFFDASSGSVHGVVLGGGRPVVVKGHRAAVTRDYLSVMLRVQHGLAVAGYPAPEPLAGPVPTGRGHLTAEAMLRCADRADGHAPAVRRTLARGLATFVDLARPYVTEFDQVVFPLAVAPGHLYPPPHSPRFDFAATAAGAEWIDEFATEARDRLAGVDAAPGAVVHGDWRVQNVCIHGDDLRAVYDWDSVHAASELRAVAIAATTFSVDWTRSDGPRFPAPTEIAGFLADYEEARIAPYSAVERDGLASAMVATLAYGARCEHSAPDPARTDDSFHGLLRRLGRDLLTDGVEALT